MAAKHEANSELRAIAGEILYKFPAVSSKAIEQLQQWVPIGPGALASVNTMASPRDAREFDSINRKNREALESLRREPAIARVGGTDDQGAEVTYYFCRGEQGMPELSVVSYLAPVGRLAALPVGDDFQLPNGRTITVRERAELRPVFDLEAWDSLRTVAEGQAYGTVTIQSLRELLDRGQAPEQLEDLLSQILAEENERQNVFEGVRRSVITKMGLRDQPVLDKYQDDIFRLPLDTRLLILGPPGTGKTTTLIRRLAQKVDQAFLDEDEQRLVENVRQYTDIPHSDSWLMFTPTELLKQYLKEAFNREKVPAPDRMVWTWSDYRRYLARDVFGLLRTSTGRGSFILRSGLETISGDAVSNSIEWFEDFDRHQRDAFVDELRVAANKLGRGSDANSHDLSHRLIAALASDEPSNLVPLFRALAPFAREAEASLATLKADTDARVRGGLNVQVNKNKRFLEEFMEFLDSLRSAAEIEYEETEDPDLDTDVDADEEDDDDIFQGRTGRAAAINIYMRTVRAQARALANKRSLGKASRYGQISAWLGDQTLPPTELHALGESLIVQAGARVIARPVSRYFRRLGSRYRAFRRTAYRKGRWYAKGPHARNEISPLELDLILLANLRAAGNLLANRAVLRESDHPYWQPLRDISGNYRNQVLVDEATDFSPVQLACMAASGRPSLKSFCGCGDFNQRLTTWGTRTPEQMAWALQDFDTRSVEISYRQSRQLAEFASDLIGNEQGDETTSPKDVSNEGVKPALVESVTLSEGFDWIAARIREIEAIVDALPSIAVLVNNERDVAPVAKELGDRLTEHNIPVMACHEGQAVGQESNVRVFDIQHIKGLEFEAAFFVSIDDLANAQPELFDKYVYVGATRAATYLGLTCRTVLPDPLVRLRPHFGDSWGVS